MLNFKYYDENIIYIIGITVFELFQISILYVPSNLL
jgi:hypothetical protein